MTKETRAKWKVREHPVINGMFAVFDEYDNQICLALNRRAANIICGRNPEEDLTEDEQVIELDENMTTEEPTWLHEARKEIAKTTEATHGSANRLLKFAVEAYHRITSPEARAAIADLESHRAAWRNGLEIARNHAEVSPPDIDDKSYWDHQLRAFDRTFGALLPDHIDQPDKPATTPIP